MLLVTAMPVPVDVGLNLDNRR